MKVGTDSDLLGTLSEGGSRILDIGTGTGVLSLMLAQRYPEARITAVEIDDNAVKDASYNFAHSPFANRIELCHEAFQTFLDRQDIVEGQEEYDSVVCNPPYFDKSLECDNLSKTRARHSSSLPFDVLIGGAYRLLRQGGVFSVCIPPEVLAEFTAECVLTGFTMKHSYQVKAVPERPPKRYVLVFAKGWTGPSADETCCMRDSDRSRSAWYQRLMDDFLVLGGVRK